jgi:hypothetical protein
MKPVQLLLLVSITFVISLLTNICIADENKPTQWHNISPEIQNVIHQFEGKWDSLPIKKQERLVLGAERWLKMNDSEKLAASKRFNQWQQLDEDKKNTLLAKLDSFKQLSKETQDQLRNTFDQFKKLSPEKRKKLRERFKRLSPEKRNLLRNRLLERRKLRRIRNKP